MAVSPLEVLDHRDVIRMLTDATNASPSAAGKTGEDRGRLQVNAANGGSPARSSPADALVPAQQVAASDGQRDPEQGRRRSRPLPCDRECAGDDDRAEQQRLPSGLAQRWRAPSELPERAREVSPGDAGSPSRVRSWRITIIAPTPHEKPETTAWGTFATYRPRRSTQKIIMKTEAARQTLAAPPMP